MASDDHSKHDSPDTPARRFDISKRLGSPYTWGLLLALMVAIYFSWQPLINGDWLSLSPGRLYHSHSMLENKCSTCHQTGSAAVKDEACLACHNVSDHAPAFSHLRNVGAQAADVRCGTCHVEHHAQKAFVPHDSRLCIGCHKNIQAVYQTSKVKSFSGFAEHPQFAVNVSGTDVRLDDPVNAKDQTQLKFNHALHLKPELRSADGHVTLTCQNCHELSANLSTVKPVTFDKNCRSCHTLSFDDRFQNNVVPHGDVENVYRYLLGEYAKFRGANSDISRRLENAPKRQALGVQIAAPDLAASCDATVVKDARTAEELLFTKTSCQLCHMVSLKQNFDEQASRFEIVKPKIPALWYPHTRFNHGAHQMVSCEGCHDKARASHATEDILLPKIERCRECHVQPGTAGSVPTDCATCHAFHQSKFLGRDKARGIQELVHAGR